jgi:hypothetical protein
MQLAVTSAHRLLPDDDDDTLVSKYFAVVRNKVSADK